MRKIVVLTAVALLPMSLTAAGSAHHTALATTTITVNGNGGDRVCDGVGAILGGGGNARYLEGYPAAERAQIMDRLFEPGYGASLQLLLQPVRLAPATVTAAGRSGRPCPDKSVCPG